MQEQKREGLCPDRNTYESLKIITTGIYCMDIILPTCLGLNQRSQLEDFLAEVKIKQNPVDNQES